MFSAFETLLDHTPPAWVRRLEATVLMRTFARAFDVEPPTPATLPAFREFTAACMEAASVDPDIAARYRDRLGQAAYALGARVRVLFAVCPSQAFRVTRFFYRGIGIELTGGLPGNLWFGPCYFAARYTPHDCCFMSAFDEGFMRGIVGDASDALVFASRITEGAPCCCARLQSGA
ncbi:MAG: hypothetical protein IJ087_19670 [Eggerthellaceae bacterium]|nr:hypothetical protein [Eggerthellaceae bacterium]